MDGLKVLETIKKTNPWFKTSQVPTTQLQDFKRREFSELEVELQAKEMATLVVGGRRVGKSVLMYQLIDSLLKKNIDSKKVLFIQGDNPVLKELINEGDILNTLLTLYQKYILEDLFEEISDEIYVFIDEAQNLTDWQLQVKTLIDLKYNIKFVITGSSSRQLRQGEKSPLIGRVRMHTIFPFSFADYARYNIRPLVEQEMFTAKVFELSGNFKTALWDGNINLAFEQAKLAERLEIKNDLKKTFNRYMFTGGFPWVISHQRGDDITKYLRDLLSMTISRDLLSEIRDTQSFERLMVNLCLSIGQTIKFKRLAEILGLDERSVVKYLDYYVESHWAFICSPFSFHKKTDSIKSEKKIYVIDNGILNTLAFKDESDLKTDRQFRSQVLENIIHNHLLCFRQRVVGSFQNAIPFWFEAGTRREIDFILEIKKGIIPVEVKCKPLLNENDLENLKQFIQQKSSAKFGIITTEEKLEIKDNILAIPYSIFSLLL